MILLEKIKIFVGIPFLVLLFSSILLNTLYEETFGKSLLEVKVNYYKAGVLFTDKGAFRFYSPSQRGRFNWLRHVGYNFQLRFWHDTEGELRPLLRIGCSYEIETIRSLLVKQDSSLTRIPPLPQIVGVMKQMDLNEKECDISNP
jgi:hypothetical protein